jgi:DNA-binding NarL/FixJ family response regulator
MGELGDGRMTDTAEIRLLIADGQALLREAVRIALEGEKDLVVAGEAADGPGAVAEARLTRPDVAMIDADLPSDGIAAARSILQDLPSCSVVILNASDDVEMLLQAMDAGAVGFVTKGAPLQDLIDASRAVNRGEAVVPPRILRRLMHGLVGRRSEREAALRRVGRLTRREREVLALLARGADNGGIAEALVISPETARTHVHNLMGKLGVHSRLEAAAFVMRRGVMDDLVGSDV